MDNILKGSTVTKRCDVLYYELLSCVKGSLSRREYLFVVETLSSSARVDSKATPKASPCIFSTENNNLFCKALFFKQITDMSYTLRQKAQVAGLDQETL